MVQLLQCSQLSPAVLLGRAFPLFALLRYREWNNEEEVWAESSSV